MKSTLNLPTKLKELRKKNKYSQEYVAEQLNISRQAISHWENGKAYPDIDNLVLLAELYDVSVDELLQDEPIKESAAEYIKNPQREDMKIFEQIVIAFILIVSINIPFLVLLLPVIIMTWLIYNKRNYKAIYILCILCIFIGIYETFTLYVHLTNFYGNTMIVPE